MPAQNHDVNSRVIILKAACLNGLYIYIGTYFLTTERWDE